MEKSDQYSCASSAELKHINHNHKDGVGTQDEASGTNTATDTETTTATGIASGTGEVFSQLALGLTGSTSGSLVTKWNSTSNVSGNVPQSTRVETIASQRRQIKKYVYDLPVNLAGFIAVHYPEPVYLKQDIFNEPPQRSYFSEKNPDQNYSDIIAFDISKLKLYGDNNYLLKGVAEIVSALDVDHTVFLSETIYPGIDRLNLKRPRTSYL